MGPYRQQGCGLCGLLLTQGAMGLVRQARKRCGLIGAFRLGWMGSGSADLGGDTAHRPGQP
jgi:hypothetical protein